MVPDPFDALAARPDATLDRLSLALAAEFRDVDVEAALAELDRLGAELSTELSGAPPRDAEACGRVLGLRHGFVGNRERYDDPENSMLDLVLERRTGLPANHSIRDSRRIRSTLPTRTTPGTSLR